MPTATTTTKKHWREFAPGQWESLERVEQNPRLADHEGPFLDPTEYHWIGKKTGLFAIEMRGLGMWFDDGTGRRYKEQWLTPSKEVLSWDRWPNWVGPCTLDELQKDRYVVQIWQ